MRAGSDLGLMFTDTQLIQFKYPGMSGKTKAAVAAGELLLPSLLVSVPSAVAEERILKKITSQSIEETLRENPKLGTLDYAQIARITFAGIMPAWSPAKMLMELADGNWKEYDISLFWTPSASRKWPEGAIAALAPVLSGKVQAAEKLLEPPGLSTWTGPLPRPLLGRYQLKYPHNPEGVLKFHLEQLMSKGKTKEGAEHELMKQLGAA